MTNPRLVTALEHAEELATQADQQEKVFVYIMRDEPSGLCKIGISSDPTKRLQAMITASGRPDLEMLFCCEFGEQAPDIERHALILCEPYCVCGEWFDMSYSEARAAMIEAVMEVRAETREQLGVRGLDTPACPERAPNHYGPRRTSARDFLKGA